MIFLAAILLGLALSVLGLGALSHRRRRRDLAAEEYARAIEHAVRRAHESQAEHEAVHPVPYDERQRLRATRERAERLLGEKGIAPPHDLHHRVRKSRT